MSKILEICLSNDLGGLELYMKTASVKLNAVAVISKNSKLKTAFDKDGLNYLEIGRYEFLKLSKIIDKFDISIVHLHHTKDIPTVVLAKILSQKKPKIVQTRHMHMTRFKSDFYHKFLYKNIDLMIAVSELTKNQLVKFIPENVRPKVLTSYIGVKKPRIISSDERENLRAKFELGSAFVVGIIGRIEEAKGQHIVLEACEILRKKGKNIKALVVGGAMDDEYLAGLKERYKDDKFVGFVNNPTDVMQICDFIVLATKKETFGLVLVEAMRCGVAVLGSNFGGPLEIIDDGKTGLLFESFSSEDLSKKLEVLMDDEKLRSNLAKNGKIKADAKFDEDRHLREIERILGGL